MYLPTQSYVFFHTEFFDTEFRASNCNVVHQNARFPHPENRTETLATRGGGPSGRVH
jgi:hypothetical protein